MVLASNLYYDLPKDLGSLIAFFTNFPYHKYLLAEGGLMNRWEYNAADAIANIAIMEGEIIEAKELGVLDHYYRISNLAIPALVQMQLTGVNIDIAMRDEALEREQFLMEKLLESFDQILPYKISTDKKYPHKFKPNSSKDRKVLFYEILKLRKVRNKGTITTGAIAIQRFQKDPRDYIRILTGAVGDYLKAKSMAGKLKTPLVNGRIHSSYGIGGKEEDSEKELGTGTGRLDSKKSLLLALDEESGKYVKAGTNLQNLKKGTQRRMVIPG